jgi:hypothetical protein
VPESSGVPKSCAAQDSGPARHRLAAGSAGFSLAELLVATTVLMIISAITTQALLQMTTSQQTIWNRTQMHAGVRSATELLQQEVGQAGRVALPGPGTVTLAGAVAGGLQAVAVVTTTVGVSPTAGMFVTEQLIVGAGETAETVALSAIDPVTNTITADFFFPHDAGAPVAVYGGFASGIVPTTTPDGSTGTVLKLYGDINGDGNMLYIEYTCENGKLYRNSMDWDAPGKPEKTDAHVLLSNLLPNPGGAPCFSYQEETEGAARYVINVAITLTVQTDQLDPITGQYQTESQALLSVAPRNVVGAWELAKEGFTTRIQPMPPTIAVLLP